MARRFGRDRSQYIGLNNGSREIIDYNIVNVRRSPYRNNIRYPLNQRPIRVCQPDNYICTDTKPRDYFYKKIVETPCKKEVVKECVSCQNGCKKSYKCCRVEKKSRCCDPCSDDCNDRCSDGCNNRRNDCCNRRCSDKCNNRCSDECNNRCSDKCSDECNRCSDRCSDGCNNRCSDNCNSDKCIEPCDRPCLNRGREEKCVCQTKTIWKDDCGEKKKIVTVKKNQNGRYKKVIVCQNNRKNQCAKRCCC